MIKNSEIILLKKKVKLLKFVIGALILLIIILLANIRPTIKNAQKRNNEKWKTELIKRGIMNKTENGGVKFNKVFVVKLRGE